MYIEQCPVCLLGALKESYTPDFPKILHLPVDGTSSMTVSTSSEESKVSQVRCAPWWLTIDVTRKIQALLHSWLEKLLTLNFLHQARCWIRWLGKDSELCDSVCDFKFSPDFYISDHSKLLHPKWTRARCHILTGSQVKTHQHLEPSSYREHTKQLNLNQVHSSFIQPLPFPWL